LITPNSVPVIQASPGATRYRLVGLELTVAANVGHIGEIVAFGGTQSRPADLSSELIIDRCYVHGHPRVNLFRGVLLNNALSAVVDSYISEVHVIGHDSQAIAGFNGPGPFKIANNYLEAAGENIMFGGGDPSIAGLVPSDIEIRHNHLVKRLEWRRDSFEYRGTPWTVKNLLELKNAQRVLIEQNVLENVWAAEQDGTAVLFTPRNGGSAPWSVVRDIMFRNNIVINAVGGVGVQSMDDGHPSEPLRRVTIANNLWVQVEKLFLSMTIHRVPVEDFIVDHNTAIPTRYLAHDLDTVIAPGVVRFQYTNNLTGRGVHAVKFPRTEEGFSRWLPHALVAGNALVDLGTVTDGREPFAGSPLLLPRKMYQVLSGRAAKVKNDGTLDLRSPLRGAGTDGHDIGVDLRHLPVAVSVERDRR
jgi:hypothetical protein